MRHPRRSPPPPGRRRRGLAALSVVLAAPTLGCGGGEVDAVRTGATTGSTPAPQVTATGADAETGADADAGPTMPATALEISGAADVAVLLERLGFPEDFPVADDLVAADLVGVESSQRVGAGSTTTDRSIAWRVAAADDPEQLAQLWFERGRDALDVDDALGVSRLDGGSTEGFRMTGGDEDDGSGQLTVTVIRTIGGADTGVVVEVEHEVEVDEPVPALAHPAALRDALPELTGCVPELVQASFIRYQAPDEAPDAPAYTTIFEGNCPTEASFAAFRDWAVSSDGHVSDAADHVTVSGAPGPDGTSVDASAHLGEDGAVAIRVDTSAPIA